MSIDTKDLSTSLRRLAALEHDASGVVNALHEVAEACVDLFDVTGSGIMLADEQNIPHYVAASDGSGRFLERAESSSGEGPCTEAFVNNRVTHSEDVTEDTRWPRLAEAIRGHGVRAVLGVPVCLGAIPVGTLDVYLDHRHDWNDHERRALTRYSDVVETALAAAVRAHTAGELAGQLQYALDYRVTIERAVGYLMAADGVDAVTAFNRLRRAARSQRTKIGEIAQQLLATGRLGDSGS
ncbi:MAG: GAF and ANTAR domain-containing protein [Microlunatus sp.]|nr:GAF and ANTAR domain-containing protein [Microlunatus sp.]MDN5804793.1 GAF and ANTAR domain-containing protein [Microlunatus sp.]